MNRLTKENYQEDLFEAQKTRKVKVDEHIEIGYSQANYNDDLWNKVKAVEDIEEELGIDLSILKKVLEHGQEKYVYFKDRNNKIHKCDRAIINIHVQVDVLDEPVGSGYFCQENLYLDDYGKKWGLTKEELINETNQF